MSLQNPDNIVTEERLAEFYQQILPYMGGMPDVLANKFNRADLYSTDEKLIGRWIDGKPIYQRVIEHNPAITIPLLGSAGATIYTDATIDTVIHGVTYQSTGVGQAVTWFKNGNDVKASATSYTLSAVRSIIQYTKTTDSAVEIGDDTDYSTTEKIVGTWIDGKPIWQKTFQFISGGASWVNIDSGNSHADWDISFVKSYFINTESSDGSYYGGNNVYGTLFHTPISGHDAFQVNCPSWTSGNTGYVTVCYTKTSS